MNRTLILILNLLCLLSGCRHRASDDMNMYQRAVKYVLPLIDSGYITNDFIILYEMRTNVANSVYMVYGSEGPYESYKECPSQIVKVGKKYFCFIELDEPELSVEQIYHTTNCEIGLYENDNKFWYLGISRNKNIGTLVKMLSYRDDEFYEYPELWPYLFDEYPEKTDFFVILDSHDIILSNIDSLKSDNMNFQIKGIRGSFVVNNRTDSTIVLRSDTFGRTFITVNGKDTLYYSLEDSLPLEISGRDRKYLYYETQPNIDFFHKLPIKHTLMFMNSLLKDSTYCFWEMGTEGSKIHLMYNDYFFYSLRDVSDNFWKDVCHESFFDKTERNRRFRGIMNGE